MSGNRIISQRLASQSRHRHLARLSEIKQHSSYQLRPHSTTHSSTRFDQERCLQIQRANLKLFNRIAQIVRKCPKQQPPSSYHFVKSIDAANKQHTRRQEQLNAINCKLSRRIASQQPTINNQLFLKQRNKNIKYMKQIARYPIKHMMYHQMIGQYEVCISRKKEIEITVRRDGMYGVVQLTREQYRQEMERGGHQGIIKGLRVRENGQVYYQMEETR